MSAHGSIKDLHLNIIGEAILEQILICNIAKSLFLIFIKRQNFCKANQCQN